MAGELVEQLADQIESFQNLAIAQDGRTEVSDSLG
jgi:hypothetical protein